jgi:DNA-binding HxlR family transcriptional regulator
MRAHKFMEFSMPHDPSGRPRLSTNHQLSRLPLPGEHVFRTIRTVRRAVLRELRFGVHRFKDIQTNTGAPRETLALRLRKLEESGVIERRRYCERPPRDEYVLTAAGRELAPVLNALRIWGERHAPSVTGRTGDTAGAPDEQVPTDSHPHATERSGRRGTDRGDR